MQNHAGRGGRVGISDSSRKNFPASGFLGAAVILVLAAGFLAGCDDDPVGVQGDADYVEVQLAPAGTPQAGVKVVVMDPTNNTVVAGPVVSDLNGICRFPDLPGGTFSLVAFGGADLGVISLPSGWVYRPAGGNGDTAPVNGPPVILVSSRVPAGGLPRISGQVVDADTGQPLPGAFLSTSIYPSGYLGQTTPGDDVTGADGRFTIHDIFFAPDPQTGNLVQVQPVFVTCAGFLPVSWTHHMANGDDNLDISGVTIALQAAGATGSGQLSGRLLLDGRPAPGVHVALGGLADVPGQKGAVGAPGFVATSDTAGVFLFQGLPPGQYRLLPGYLRRDGVVYLDSGLDLPRVVMADQTTQSGDHVLVHEVTVSFPEEGGVLEESGWPLLDWGDVPGAESYDVFLDRGFLGNTTESHVAVPEQFNPSEGWHVWQVQAYDQQEQVVGIMDRSGLFYLPGQPETP